MHILSLNRIPDGNDEKAWLVAANIYMNGKLSFHEKNKFLKFLKTISNKTLRDLNLYLQTLERFPSIILTSKFVDTLICICLCLSLFPNTFFNRQMQAMSILNNFYDIEC